MPSSCAEEGDWNGLSREELLRHHTDDIFSTPDRVAGNRDDHIPAADERRAEQLPAHVSGLQAGLGARCARIDLRDDGAVRDRVVEPLRDRRDQVFRLDPNVGIGDAAGCDQPRACRCANASCAA